MDATMERPDDLDGTARANDAAALDHRRLVRTLVVACIAGGLWLVARDVGFSAIGTLLN